MSISLSLTSIPDFSVQWLSLSLLVTMTLLFVGQQLCRYLYNLYLHPLAGFPGPALWAVSRIPHELGLVRGRIITDLAALHERYGDVVRVSPNSLSFIHPDAWQDIYARKPGQLPFSKDLLRYSKDLCINGAQEILTADEGDHSRLRRVLTHGFSERSIREQEPLVKSNVGLLVRRLRERIQDGAVAGKVDMSRWLNWTTFDIIGDLAFGEPFGCLEQGEYHPWVSLIFDSVRGVSIMGSVKQFPWLNHVFQSLLPASLMQKLYDHQKLGIEKIDRRLRFGSDRNDFLNIILRHNGTEKEMSLGEIYSNANLIIMAGSETSATAMAGCLYFLALNPDVLHRLRDEIRARFAREEDITFEKLVDLTYLTAVLDESMRMYPAQPIFTPRITPNGGAVVAAHFVPEQTAVGIYQWTAYHAARNFRDPDNFDPSRWLGDARYAADRKGVFKPFSTGYRNCIAKQLAYSEMRLIISSLLWNFELSLCAESRNWIDQKAYLAWQKPALMMTLSERNSPSQPDE